ncbi:MAG: fasciclin domain-containing protein [Sphingobacteriales bacterium]|nr:MAG: fasciclin domain-containing protein [Sphingobacteriales bacterium]
MKKQFFAIAAATALFAASCGETTKEGTTSTQDTTTSNTTDAGSAPAAEQGVMVGGANMVPSKNIVENASNSSDHTTLVAAVKQAGLVETLSGTGPFTVFAPANAAFDAVPKATLDGLMKPESKEKLTQILTYHVVPGSLKAADLKDGQKLKTVEGKELTVKVADGKVWINDAEVTIADVVSSNGVTHVVNKVLMP